MTGLWVIVWFVFAAFSGELPLLEQWNVWAITLIIVVALDLALSQKE